jgi:hypothetical protein
MNRFKRYIDKWLTWTVIRSFGNSRLAKLTILNLFIGHIILNNQYWITYIGVSWEWYFYYFGLYIIGAATMIYIIMCPDQIKNYKTSVDYISGTIDYLGGTTFERIPEDLDGKEYLKPNLKKWADEYTKAMEKARGDLDKIIRARDVYTREILDLHFDILNKSRIWFLRFAFFLYIMGIGLILIPVINGPLRVLESLL